VRCATAAAFRTALEQRLLTTARGAGILVVRLRKLVVFDRLLARLPAVRYHVAAELAGRPFEEVTVDVGFSDPPVAQPERLRGPHLLSFAAIAPVEVPALPLEQHVAEKVHAYTRSYTGGHASTRAKDLVDLTLVSSLFRFQAGPLRSALRATFDGRGTHPLPVALPVPPPGWGPAYRKVAAEVGLEPEVSIGYQQVAAFLNAILGGAVGDAAQWDPSRRTW
jgi:hypothetical protein